MLDSLSGFSLSQTSLSQLVLVWSGLQTKSRSQGHVNQDLQSLQYRNLDALPQDLDFILTLLNSVLKSQLTLDLFPNLDL